MSEGPRYEKPKQIKFEEALEEIQTVINQVIEISSLREYQMRKTSTINIFQNGKVMLCHQ